MKKYIEIGKIVSVQGLKGEVRVEGWCDDNNLICEFNTLYLNGGSEEIEITSSKLHKNIILMKIKGINTVEQAQALRNEILYINRDDVKLEEGRYFIQDLIGLDVRDIDNGNYYGKITEVSPTGANDVYHIEDKNGKIRLIPAIPDVIKDIDFTEGNMYVHILEGLFDEN